jgi:hypothetical protein
VTETSVVCAESLTSATETLSSDSTIETLTSSITVDGTTSTEQVSTTITEDATTAAASTTTAEETPTTTTVEAGPQMTPGSVVGTGPVADLTLHGDGTRFAPLSFTPSASTQTLIFTLVNKKLSLGNNNYLCVTFKAEGVLGPLVLCPFDNFSSFPLDCERGPSGTLACTAPATYCLASGTCRRPNVATPFSQFYVDNGQSAFFGPPGTFDGFTALDLVLAQ